MYYDNANYVKWFNMSVNKYPIKYMELVRKLIVNKLLYMYPSFYLKN